MRIRSTEDLGAVVRERRRELGVSQAELAERADVTRQWIIRFERGTTDVSLAKAISVLQVLDLELRADATGAAAIATPQLYPIRIPKIEVPRMDLSGIDWQAVSQRIAASKVDLSATLARLGATKVPGTRTRVADAEHEGTASDA